MREALSDYTHVATYRYRLADGTLVFEKRRYERLQPITGARSKTFRYWDPARHAFSKPPGADALLYRLPGFAAAIRTGETIHWTEGEKDADALVRAGVFATSHHQGAGRITPEQANLLSGAARVVIWMDRDDPHPEVGAYDAALRYNLLLDAGLAPRQLRVVAALTGKDAADHLAHHSYLRARSVNLLWLEQTAKRHSPSVSRRLGYPRG
jgi:DNA primase